MSVVLSARKEPVVGTPELLDWLSGISNWSITSFADLKDGAALLRAFVRIFPTLDVRKAKISDRPKFDWDIKSNWDVIRSCMETLRLPMGLYNPKGIQAGQFKPCYGLLVLLFFLFHLAEHKDFTVDFAHPIDNKLATFLQSPASVDSLVIGGSLQLPADGGAATAIGPASVGVSPRVSARHSARKANPSVTSHYADRDSAPPSGREVPASPQINQTLPPSSFVAAPVHTSSEQLFDAASPSIGDALSPPLEPISNVFNERAAASAAALRSSIDAAAAIWSKFSPRGVVDHRPDVNTEKVVASVPTPAATSQAAAAQTETPLSPARSNPDGPALEALRVQNATLESELTALRQTLHERTELANEWRARAEAAERMRPDLDALRADAANRDRLTQSLRDELESVKQKCSRAEAEVDDLTQKVSKLMVEAAARPAATAPAVMLQAQPLESLAQAFMQDLIAPSQLSWEVESTDMVPLVVNAQSGPALVHSMRYMLVSLQKQLQQAKDSEERTRAQFERSKAALVRQHQRELELVAEDAKAAQLAADRQADDQRASLHAQLHSQFAQLRYKHEFESAQLSLPSAGMSASPSVSSLASATPRSAAATAATSTSDRLLLSLRQQLETVHRQLHAKEFELEQERAHMRAARDAAVSAQQNRVAALKSTREVLIADSQSLVQAVLSEGRTPLFSASESNGESIEQLQAIVLRLQAEHAAQYHEAQREIERLRYACADQQMAPVLQAVELQARLVRAQAESTQLRHVNAFLRARSSTVDLRLQALITPQLSMQELPEAARALIESETTNGDDTESEMAAVWLPSSNRDVSAAETRNVNIHRILERLSVSLASAPSASDDQTSDISQLRTMFWEVLADDGVLRHRVARARQLLRRFHAQLASTRDKLASARADSERKAAELSVRAMQERHVIEQQLNKDRATLQVRLELAEGAVKDARAIEERLRTDLAAAQRQSIAADQEHFRSLQTRLQRCMNDAYRYRLRDQMLQQLLLSLSNLRAAVPALSSFAHQLTQNPAYATAAAGSFSGLGGSTGQWAGVALIGGANSTAAGQDAALRALSDPSFHSQFNEVLDGMQALQALHDADSASSGISSVSALSLSASEAVAAATVALERELRAQHEQTNDALRRLDAVKDEADRWRVAAESSQKRATLAQQHEAEARQLVQQTAVDLGSQRARVAELQEAESTECARLRALSHALAARVQDAAIARTAAANAVGNTINSLSVEPADPADLVPPQPVQSSVSPLTVPPPVAAVPPIAPAVIQVVPAPSNAAPNVPTSPPMAPRGQASVAVEPAVYLKPAEAYLHASQSQSDFDDGESSDDISDSDSDLDSSELDDDSYLSSEPTPRASYAQMHQPSVPHLTRHDHQEMDLHLHRQQVLTQQPVNRQAPRQSPAAPVARPAASASQPRLMLPTMSSMAMTRSASSGRTLAAAKTPNSTASAAKAPSSVGRVQSRASASGAYRR